MNFIVDGKLYNEIEPILNSTYEQLKGKSKEVQELFIYELLRKLYYEDDKMGEHWKPLFQFCSANLTSDSHLSLNQKPASLTEQLLR